MGLLPRSDRRPRAPLDRERGQSIVEFALMLPLMLIILLAIADLGRIYTTVVNVESAAREAADFGTTLGAGHWSAAAKDDTTAEMVRRACVASSNLPDYVGDDPGGAVVTCTNPSFSYCLTTTTGGPCEPFEAAAACEDPLRDPPCRVTVRLSYDFHLFTPVGIALPTTISFQRDSTFAMTDIDLVPTP
jgi:Flp pilus assembly protein TadG